MATPSGFVYPKGQAASVNYGSLLSKALQGIQDSSVIEISTPSYRDEALLASDAARIALTMPASSSCQTLITLAESYVGSKLSDITGGKAGAQVVANVVGIVNAAIEGNVQAIVQGGLAVASTVASALGVVPVIGQIAGVLVDVVFWFVGMAGKQSEYEAMVAQQQTECQESLLYFCRGAMDGFSPVAASATGMVPADMFRSVMYARHIGAPPPPTIPGMIVSLCGDEAVGFANRKSNTNLYYGISIPRSTQRLMWKLIEAIMAACREPGVIGSENEPNDGGKAIYPILLDIVRSEYIRNHWDDNTGANIAYGLLRQLGRDWAVGYAPCEGGWGCGRSTVSCSCESNIAAEAMRDSLKITISQYENAMVDGGLVVNGKYKATGVRQSIKNTVKTSSIKRVTLSSASAKRLVSGLVEAKSKLTPSQKAAVAASAVGGGYITWEIIRRIMTGGI
jgi:hypothetical protein